MQCATCGHANRDTAKFCEQCGQALRAAATPAPRPARLHAPPSGRAHPDRSRRARGRAQAGHGAVRRHPGLDAARRAASAPRPGTRCSTASSTLLNEGVHRFEGTVNQYTGDGVMALFGAPLAHEDHAQRACHAALHLRERLRAFAAELRAARGIDLAVRIGLNSGEVVVGTDRRRSAHGLHRAGAHRRPRAARRAARRARHRLRGAGDRRAGGRLLRAARSRRRSRSRASANRCASTRSSGLGRARTRIDVVRARSAARLVGRRTELAVLEQALDEAMAGHGRVLGVVGEPGVGKTRLCLELLRQCRARGVDAGAGALPGPRRRRRPAAHPRAAALAVRHRAPAMRPTRSREQDPPRPAAARPRLRRRAARSPATCSRSPTRSSRCRCSRSSGARSWPPSCAAWCRRRAPPRRCCCSSTTCTASIPTPTRCWARSSTRWAGRAPCCWSTSAPAITPPGCACRTTASCRSPRSSDDDTDALLRRLVGDDASTADLRRLIRERTGGNPFFVEEVVQSLIDRGALTGRRPRRRGPGRRRARPAPAARRADRRALDSRHRPGTAGGTARPPARARQAGAAGRRR